MAVWSQISTANLVGAVRLDAEFWQPKYLDKEQAIRSGDHVNLGALVNTFKKGIFYILAREYSETGIPFFRSSNVGAILPSDDGVTFITEKKHSEEYKTALSQGDLMLVKTGRSGASVVLSESCNVSQDVVAVKVDRDSINPYYLAVYLNTLYGKSEMDRWFQGQVQPHLSLEDARRIWVYIAPQPAQDEVEKLVRSAAAMREKERTCWNYANELLNKGLELDKQTFSKSASINSRFSVANLAATFEANRIDAQCFSPEALFYDHLLSSAAQFDHLGSLLVNVVKGRQQVESASGPIDYCSIKHISGREIVGAEKTCPTKGSSAAGPGDLLLAITGATIGKIGIVKRYQELTFSGDMLRLRPNARINTHFLLLALSHHLGQVQFNRWITGSTNGHLSPKDVERVLVPRLSLEQENEIASLVEQSLEARQESETLLEQAKACVEQLIEEAVAA